MMEIYINPSLIFLAKCVASLLILEGLRLSSLDLVGLEGLLGDEEEAMDVC